MNVPTSRALPNSFQLLILHNHKLHNPWKCISIGVKKIEGIFTLTS